MNVFSFLIAAVIWYGFFVLIVKVATWLDWCFQWLWCKLSTGKPLWYRCLLTVIVTFWLVFLSIQLFEFLTTWVRKGMTK